MNRSPFVHALILVFVAGILGPSPLARADELTLPKAGAMVALSSPFNPPVLKGIKVDPRNPLRLDFLLDKGEGQLNDRQMKAQSARLVRYFLASLTIPEKDLWVNLSPYEKDRIIPDSFGLTEMGRDLLAQDYLLKQITASLVYPENEFGKKFWQRIYTEAARKFGTTDIPVNTFNKVWIAPDKAVIYENAKTGTAYVVESKLKVMLESDYLAAFRNEAKDSANTLGKQIVREIVIPELNKEVNTGRNFVPLRQVYQSLILAAWYKKKIKDGILGKVYVDRNKVVGVNVDGFRDKEKIYNQYLRAFKSGAYNYIKEEVDPVSRETVTRKYFSGGMTWSGLNGVIRTVGPGIFSSMASGIKNTGLAVVLVSLGAWHGLDQASFADAVTKSLDNHAVVADHAMAAQTTVSYPRRVSGRERPVDRRAIPLNRALMQRRQAQSILAVTVNPSLVAKEFYEKIDFKAADYKTYIAQLSRKERREFETSFMEDLVRAIGLYEQSGTWNHHLDAQGNKRTKFILPGETLVGNSSALENNGFYDSPYFIDTIVRRYLLTEGVPIPLDFNAPQETGAYEAQLKARKLMKDAVHAVSDRFLEGRLMIEGVSLNLVYRWVRKSMAFMTSIATELGLSFVIPVVMMAVHKLMGLGSFQISAILAVAGGIVGTGIHLFFHKHALPEIGRLTAEAVRTYLRNDYDQRLQAYIFRLDPQTDKKNRNRYHSYFEEIRYGLPLTKEDKQLLDEIERAVLRNLGKNPKQYLWIAKIGAELVRNAKKGEIRMDARTVSIAMLKELADQDNTYFNDLVRGDKTLRQRIVAWFHGKAEWSLSAKLKDMLPLIELQRRENYIKGKAAMMAESRYTDAYQRDVETTRILKEFSQGGDGIDKDFLLYLFTKMNRLDSPRDRRAVMLSYFLGAGGARLDRIRQAEKRNDPVDPAYEERVYGASGYWIQVLNKIKEKESIRTLYDFEAIEIEAMVTILREYLDPPPARSLPSPDMNFGITKEDVDLKGGIDLDPRKMDLQVRDNGEKIELNIDPAMLKQLQNAPGFVPIILNIRPMDDIRIFLGL